MKRRKRHTSTMYHILTTEELEQLKTSRLLKLFKSVRSRHASTQACNSRDPESAHISLELRLFDYSSRIQSILNTREHIEK